MTAETTASRGAHRLYPLESPSQAGGLGEVFRRRFLLKLLVRKELRVRYQSSIVGLAWSYVQPLVRFAMYYWILGLIISGRTPDRALHIFSGLLIVSFFSDCMTSGTKSVLKNKSLVRKINLPREMFPVASVCVSLFHLFPMYVILLFGALITGWHPDGLAFAAMAMAFVIILLYGLATALLLSAIYVFLRDTINVVEVINTVLRWTVPMIYPFSLIGPKLAPHPWLYESYASSPLVSAVTLNDRAFWIPTFPNVKVAAAQEMPTYLIERGLGVIVVGVVYVFVAQYVFKRLEGRFAEQN